MDLFQLASGDALTKGTEVAVLGAALLAAIRLISQMVSKKRDEEARNDALRASATVCPVNTDGFRSLMEQNLEAQKEQTRILQLMANDMAILKDRSGHVHE